MKQRILSFSLYKHTNKHTVLSASTERDWSPENVHNLNVPYTLFWMTILFQISLIMLITEEEKQQLVERSDSIRSNLQ